MLDVGEPRGLLDADKVFQLLQVLLSPKAPAGGVPEGGDPADHLSTPTAIVGTVGNDQDRQIPALVDDPTPELSRLVPAIEPGVRPQDQERAEDGPRELVGGDRQAEVDPLGRQEVRQPDRRCEDTERHGGEGDPIFAGPGPVEDVRPEGRS